MAKLILIRHGQSIWNQQNRFTGWVDVSLSRQGIEEAQAAGQLLKHAKFDVAFTSVLIRAQDTLYEILKVNEHCRQYVRIHEQSSSWYEHFTPAEGDQAELKIYASEKLNERYYGDLQGLDKKDTADRFGEKQVHTWRRSYEVAPPGGESLAMTARRTIGYYRDEIEPRLRAGGTVLISAHGNSLRSIVMHIEGMTAQQITAYELATGTPHIYTFDAQLRITGKERLRSQ